VIASLDEVICFNVNNSIVEEKYNLENSTIPSQMKWFFKSFLQHKIYSIDVYSSLVVIDHKGYKNSLSDQALPTTKEPDKESETNLFENRKILGMHYVWSYDLLCVWNAHTLKVFKGPGKLV
jgi:hypothetical protein